MLIYIFCFQCAFWNGIIIMHSSWHLSLLEKFFIWVPSTKWLSNPPSFKDVHVCHLLYGLLGMENTIYLRHFFFLLILASLAPTICVLCTYGSVSLCLGDWTPGLNQSQSSTLIIVSGRGDGNSLVSNPKFLLFLSFSKPQEHFLNYLH